MERQGVGVCLIPSDEPRLKRIESDLLLAIDLPVAEPDGLVAELGEPAISRLVAEEAGSTPVLTAIDLDDEPG